jgi:hypothetical protein
MNPALAADPSAGSEYSARKCGASTLNSPFTSSLSRNLSSVRISERSGVREWAKFLTLSIMSGSSGPEYFLTERRLNIASYRTSSYMESAEGCLALVMD